MQLILIYMFKIMEEARIKILKLFDLIITYIILYLNGVKFSTFRSQGIPYIHISLKAQCLIGKKFLMNNGVKYSDSGLNGKCRIEVRDTAVLTIGDNVGMSDTTITCHEKITIGNNVMLGVGTQIRDTDNHSLNPQDRLNGLDWINKKKSPIVIHDNVFIGAYSFVLKGVTIGENAIIGAGSVVTKNIADNEVWAGNPAKLIRKHYAE